MIKYNFLILLLLAIKFISTIDIIDNVLHIDYTSDKFIDHLNHLNSTWKAGRNFDQEIMAKKFKNLKVVDEENVDEENQQPKLHNKRQILIPDDYIPDYFDARQKWPLCRTISLIPNQGQYCSSCWAVGVVQAINDRICIGSNQRINVEISAQDLLTCCKECTKNGEGCQGGYPSRGWKYWITNGLVTGGQHGDLTTCQPFNIPPMNLATFTPYLQLSHIIQTPVCQQQCVNGKNYAQDKYYGLHYYKVPNDERSIRREIYHHGPVEANYRVYPDFHHYKTGIYQHLLGTQSEGHSIKIIGWGTENGIPYWLCANSWTKLWGNLGGFFKIIRGQNHCGIENQVYGGWPRL